jgi:hypothetical protein
MPNVIILKGEPLRDEFTAGGAVTPGHLVDPQAGVVHATADGNAEKCFALENPWVETAAGSKSIDEAYSSGDTVLCGYFNAGDVVYAILAASMTIAAGDALASAGDGTLQTVTAAAATTQAERDSIVAYAEEAVTTTTATARIKVRVA